VSALKKAGFIEVRQRGSHVSMQRITLGKTQLGQAETKKVIYRYLSMLPTLCHFSVIFKTLIHADLR